MFLAGGISNCPNWQVDALDLLDGLDLTVYNPRRSGVLIPDEAVPQIKWEHSALKTSESVLFWFPSETLCPITLYELGVFSERKNVNVFAGTHPEYLRRLDVIIQTELSRPEIIVRDNLVDTVNDFISFYKSSV